MGKKKDKKRTAAPDRSASQASSSAVDGAGAAGTTGGAARWVAIGLLVVGTGFFVYASMHPGATSAGSGSGSSTSPTADGSRPAPKDPGQTGTYRYFEDPAAARPFPVTLPPSEFKNQGIANTYRIAKEIPEVLSQQPCLCGCDKSYEDHRSLLDCYRDQHASTCTICMKEAILADKMTKEGRSAQEIREAIIRHDFAELPIGN